jgi:predicted HicB family RNase H-like nuclease
LQPEEIIMKEKDQLITKKLSVILDAKLHNHAKRHALLNDKALTELVIELLEKRLNQE